MSERARYYRLREQWGDSRVESWIVKVIETDDGPVFDAYVGLDRHNRVIERSSGYGVFEGRAGDFPEESGASAADEKEFVAAWQAPRAPLSMRRRVLQWLNGVNDDRDPTRDAG